MFESLIKKSQTPAVPVVKEQEAPVLNSTTTGVIARASAISALAEQGTAAKQLHDDEILADLDNYVPEFAQMNPENTLQGKLHDLIEAKNSLSVDDGETIYNLESALIGARAFLQKTPDARQLLSDDNVVDIVLASNAYFKAKQEIKPKAKAKAAPKAKAPAKKKIAKTPKIDIGDLSDLGL